MLRSPMHVRRKRTPATTNQRSLRRSSRSTFSTTFFLQGSQWSNMSNGHMRWLWKLSASPGKSAAYVTLSDAMVAKQCKATNVQQGYINVPFYWHWRRNSPLVA
jgi:hypothetical protein